MDQRVTSGLPRNRLRDHGVPKLSIHAVGSEARTGAYARSYSDRTDYSHTERKLTEGRRAAERAAYATLKVSHDASEAEIKAQFRKLAMLYHPDVRPRCTA